MSNFLISEEEDITFVTYKDESMMPDIQRLVSADLSEPYSIYLFRYFICTWPELCICAYSKNTETGAVEEMIGVIVSKAEIEYEDHNANTGLSQPDPTKDDVVNRGYIAMLAVNKAFRKKGLGGLLVKKGINAMVSSGVDEVYLEAEYVNTAALALYEKLGFSRDEKLGRYYLNGSDAYRLKLRINKSLIDSSSRKAEEE